MNGKVVIVRSRYNYDVKAVSMANGKNTGRETPVKQSFKEESNINTLVRRFGLMRQHVTGLHQPIDSADFTQVVDYHSLMNIKRRADEAFMALPSELRDRFANDPHKYMAFCSARNEKGDYVNLEEMRKLGIARPARAPEPPPPPMKVEVVNPVVAK